MSPHLLGKQLIGFDDYHSISPVLKSITHSPVFFYPDRVVRTVNEIADARDCIAPAEKVRLSAAGVNWAKSGRLGLILYRWSRNDRSNGDARSVVPQPRVLLVV